MFLSKIEKAKTSIVPIKTQSADYEICEESASETINRIQRVAIALFVGYIDAALTMSESYGGGGSISSNWGKNEDDDWLWARKCATKAMWLCKPRMRYGRGR